MTKEQRIAISRVISDMIKADNIIEETEIQDMKQLMSDYSLTRQDMEAAQNIKLSDAIPVLRVLPKKVREELVNKIYGIAQSDNVCVPREALLLIALKYCLLDEEKKQIAELAEEAKKIGGSPEIFSAKLEQDILGNITAVSSACDSVLSGSNESAVKETLASLKTVLAQRMALK